MRPRVRLLDEELVESIVAQAKKVLAEIGIEFLGTKAREVLEDAGLEEVGGRYCIPADIVDRVLEAAPSSFTMFGRDGDEVARLGGDSVNFTPGSAALNYFDYEEGKARKPTTKDFVRFTRVADNLEHLYATATAFIPGDVPEDISDAWRLYLALRYTTKPVVTGSFSVENLALMADLLQVVRGGREELAKKPLAIFSCCPSSPLRFTEATSDNLIECARRGIPAELIGMPVAGLVAPVTLALTLVQHTVEDLSGVVLSQLASPGAPLLWGGSPSVFDIRNATTPLAAIESMMLAAGYVQIGKHLGLPTQAYMGLSDSKLLDMQAGFESGLGHMTAALAGTNSISGPGMLELENCQSIEKLIIDNEICGALKFMLGGIEPVDDGSCLDILRRLLKEKNLIIDEHTMKHRPSQRQDPSTVVCRADRKRWRKQGSTSASERAHARAEEILAKHEPALLDEARSGPLREIMAKAASEKGMDEFPDES